MAEIWGLKSEILMNILKNIVTTQVVRFTVQGSGLFSLRRGRIFHIA